MEDKEECIDYNYYIINNSIDMYTLMWFLLLFFFFFATCTCISWQFDVLINQSNCCLLFVEMVHVICCLQILNLDVIIIWMKWIMYKRCLNIEKQHKLKKIVWINGSVSLFSRCCQLLPFYSLSGYLSIICQGNIV